MRIRANVDKAIDRLLEPAAATTLVFVAIYTTLWGIWLLVFDVFGRADLYSWLSDVAPEEVFGAAGVVAGVAMLATTLKAEFPWVTYGAFLGALFWGIISMGYLLGDYQHTGGITAAGLSLYSAFCYLNFRLNRD